MRRSNPTQASASKNISIGSVLASVLLLFATTAVHAQSTTTFAEQYKQIQAPNAVASIGSDLFGDQVNLYNGKLEFVQTDVSLKGNNALPVSVGRRFVAGTDNVAGRQFFHWDLDVPHLHGIFSARDKWRAINGAPVGARCSNFGAPPDVLGTSRTSWTATEFWQGNFIYIPGQGDQQMMSHGGDSTVPGPIATYPVRTAKWWYFSCLPSMKNDSSEGFVALSPDGTRYQFDWIASFPVSQINKDAGWLIRNEVWILPSRITDRFGNYVDYTYDPVQPKNLTKIKSSDGREINLTYSGTDGLVRTVSDGTRTLNYSYSNQLDLVTLPDNSTWNFANAYGLIDLYPGPSADDCDYPATLNGILKQGSMVHPSGATGTFVMTPMAHGRSDVPRQCLIDATSQTYWPRIPRYFYSNSLTSKTITGPGLPSMTWAYDYGPLNASWAPCDASCAFNKTVSVTDPQGIVTAYQFGNRYNETEGRLESVNVGGQRTTTTRYRAFGAGPYPNYAGASGGNSVGDADMLTRLAPADQRVITQDGVTFVWEAGASSFDVLGRPTQITRSSSLGMTRTEITQFEDNVPAWVISQVKQVTETTSGKVMVLNSYNSTTANLESTSNFGQAPQSMTYYGDGTVATRKDGKNQTTSFSNYKRGVPQNVAYADGTSESAVVDNIGNVTSLTNAVGFPTVFGYTAGRLSSISYPTDPTMNGATLSFAPVAATEFDLPAGHWKQTVSTGNARTISYFDAFWRPAYSYTYDIGNEGGTGRLVKRQYDSKGRTTFESYPKRTYGDIGTGVQTQYDALGRVTATGADSELGVLWTTSSYFSGFQKSMTDPKGHVTTSSFQVFDEPSESAVSTIAAPLGVGVAIARDVFGKPLSITRSGGLSATRSYVYDAQARLCKTIEPETGSTVQDYDAANNVIWRASGNALSATTSCDTGSVAAARKVTFGYDSMNRLTSTSYADGSPAITRSYTNDGLPATVTSNGAVWSNSYDNRRHILLEKLSYGGAEYNIARSYDGNGSLANLTYPDGLTSLAYFPNALGQPTQVGSYASGITYHPNGAIAGFTYGNGVTHTLTQNTRGLPSQSIDAGVINDSYTYDADGNVAGIADLQMGTTNRTMGYDDLERLTSVSAPNLWGNATYTYDALDNLRTSTITAGATARSLTMNYPDASTNRLMSTSGGPAGFNFGYSYDVQGNIIQRGTQSYVFDQGNRMTSAPGKATYGYDGLGHRVSVIGSDGVNRVQVYTQGGQILYAGPAGSTGSKYVYLHNHLLAELWPGGGQYSHTDGLGSPVARTDGYGTLISRTRYEPYGYTAAGAVSGIGFTGHVNDADTALVYMQQRYYDPVAGRFLSIDPVTTDAQTGSSFNRYVYANNSPFRYIDPDGRQAQGIDINCTGGCETYGSLANASGGVGRQSGRRFTPAPPAPTEGVESICPECYLIGIGGAGRIAAKEAVPLIKAGAAGGETGGKIFPQSVKDAAKGENPLSTCVYCRMKGTGTQVDHAIPRARGGNATLENAQMACPHCNASKGARDFPVNPPPGYRGEWPPAHW